MAGMWKGAIDGGKAGYFDPYHSAPYIEIKTASPAHKKLKAKISRKGTAI